MSRFKYKEWYFTTLIALLGAVALFYVIKQHMQSEHTERQLKLKSVHNMAINQLSNSMNEFAAIVGALKSYVELADEMPEQKELQSFLKMQLRHINFQDSIIISYLDTTHTFIYVFTPNEIDPANLIGSNVSAYRDQEEIDRLEQLMQQDELMLFYPINLVEGWVGLPLNFRVNRNGETLGYFACLINLKSIIQRIYDSEEKANFTFKFTTDEGVDFDRERYHDGSEVYNSAQDEEFYKNYDIDAVEYLLSEVNHLGMTFNIGTAFKQKEVAFGNFEKFVSGAYLIFLCCALFITYQLVRYRKLNAVVEVNNRLLEESSKISDEQNKELTKLNDTKNQLFKIIGHDLRSPLFAIEQSLGLLIHDREKDPITLNILNDLLLSTEQTVLLLNNLLDWAKAQTGESEFIPQEISLKETLTEVIGIVKPFAKKKRIKILHDIVVTQSIVGDRNMIISIFYNLLTNAVKYSNEGDKITIIVDADKENFIITVADTGVGMPSDKAKNLFQLDFHLHSEGTLGEGGTGLGLQLCKEFVERHKGHIAANSEPEKGTTVTVTLPR